VTGPTVHPDLEHYYDRATDRAAVDAHLATCPECRAWLDDIHERIGHMACREFVELVTEFLDDAVDDRLRARIDDHLRLCEGCRNYLDQMRNTVATMGRIPLRDAPPASVRAGVLAAFRAWRAAAPGRHHLED